MDVKFQRKIRSVNKSIKYVELLARTAQGADRQRLQEQLVSLHYKKQLICQVRVSPRVDVIVCCFSVVKIWWWWWGGMGCGVPCVAASHAGCILPVGMFSELVLRGGLFRHGFAFSFITHRDCRCRISLLLVLQFPLLCDAYSFRLLLRWRRKSKRSAVAALVLRRRLVVVQDSLA